VKGLKLEFKDGVMPSQLWKMPNIRFNEFEANVIDGEVTKLLEKGVIVESVHEPGEYINTIFIRPKPNGDWRMILNMKKLNSHIEYYKFKMDTIRNVFQLLYQGCYMAKLDIKDAYYSVAIDENHQKFLKFQWRRKLYKFVVLPNGYSQAPRRFTKLMKPICSVLRKQGHTILIYIDDVLILAESKAQCRESVAATKSLLEHCGFVIHTEKSETEPVHQIQYLGFILNSENMTSTLPACKKEHYIELCTQLIKANTSTAHEIASVVGKLVSSFYGVQFGPMHYRDLEKAKIRALQSNDGDYSSKLKITPAMKKELQWWVSNLPSAYYKIERGQIDVEIHTDSTKKSWGAVCGTEKAGDWFRPDIEQYCNDNINAFELMAVFLALQSFESKIRGKNVLVRCDNMTAVAYVSHFGGIRSALCNEIATQIWEWCIDRNVWLS
jgi:hypothetical protein